MRRLIVNADDFGLTAGVNHAIAEGHNLGIVTSATLMARGRAFDDAVRLAHSTPKLSVGCHVVLVDGEPVLRPEQVRSLLAPAKREGLPFAPIRTGTARRVAVTTAPQARFHNGFGGLAVGAVRRGLDSNQIQQETEAQIRQLQAAGIEVTHVDAHKHTHMLPQVADAVMRAAVSCGVRAIRNPFVPLRPIIFAHVLRRPKLWKRYGEVTVLRKYHQSFLDRVRMLGMVTPDGSFGVISTGTLDLNLFRAIVGSIPDGTWELVCHPGYNDAELGLVRTRLRESRARELAILTSPAARSILEQHDIQLISYRELALTNA